MYAQDWKNPVWMLSLGSHFKFFVMLSSSRIGDLIVIDSTENEHKNENGFVFSGALCKTRPVIPQKNPTIPQRRPIIPQTSSR